MARCRQHPDSIDQVLQETDKVLTQFFCQIQEKAPLIGFAMASGVCIFFGNMGLMYSLCLAGVTIAVPLFSSFIVIVGEFLFCVWIGMFMTQCNACMLTTRLQVFVSQAPILKSMATLTGSCSPLPQACLPVVATVLDSLNL